MTALPLWAVTLALLAALIVGIVASPRVRKHFHGEDDASFGSITAPLIAITTLTLSFSLVSVWGSFHQASVAASDEALAVDYQSDIAQQLPDARARQDLEATLVCYARAIAGPEWQVMKQRGEATADEVDPWTDRLQASTSALASAVGGPAAAARELIGADKERGNARSRRLTQARPSMPLAVLALLLAVASMAVIALALAHIPVQRRWLHVAALSVVTLAILGLFILITELDSPFHGLIDIESTDMTRVASAEAADFAETYPGVALPCDESGRVLG